MSNNDHNELDIHGESWTLRYLTGRAQPSDGKSDLFLKDANGQEHTVTPSDIDIPAREGHLVTVGYAIGRDGAQWPFIAVNHDTGDTRVRNDVVQQQLCGQHRMQKRIASRFRMALVTGGAIIGYLTDHRHPFGNAIFGALIGLLFGWLVGIIVSGLGAAKVSHDRMNTFLSGPQLAAIRRRIASEKK
jgi:hypothetical protein|nr:hypothetical protein [uncultured Steroidobacter sp.]